MARAADVACHACFPKAVPLHQDCGQQSALKSWDVQATMTACTAKSYTDSCKLAFLLVGKTNSAACLPALHAVAGT